MKNFGTPILFLIFNRPKETEAVFEEIKKIKPTKLFIAADGPRIHKSEDKEKCLLVRKIASQIDWPCAVETLFRDKNLGCKIAVSSAIDWFFNNVDEGIILEDDCLPNESFFLFCQNILEEYRNNKQIMMVSGTNLIGEWKAKVQDFHFSYYGGIWGWATWKRAWKLYDVDMKGWADEKNRGKIRQILGNEQYAVREKVFDETYHRKIDTWDYQWSFSRLVNQGLSVVPSVNLIANIGFNDDATHTKKSDTNHSNIIQHNINFPLRINKHIAVDSQYDLAFFLKVSHGPTGNYAFLEKIKNFLKKSS